MLTPREKKLRDALVAIGTTDDLAELNAMREKLNALLVLTGDNEIRAALTVCDALIETHAEAHEALVP